MAAIELIQVGGPGEGHNKRFEDPNIYIAGYSDRCAVKISSEDPEVSSEHFMIEVNPPRAWIRDLGSHSGTYINDERLASNEQQRITRELKSGETIRAGKTLFQFNIADDGLSASDVYVVFKSTKNDASTQGPSEFVAPYQIPGFELLSQSISGTMGSVFQARHEATKKLVTLKTITPVVAISTYRMNQIRRELEFIGEFDHPNIVSFVASGEFSHGFFIATEFSEGGNLKTMVKELSRPFSTEEAIPLVLEALKGLEYIHSKGIAHGDLKPSNLFLSQDRRSVRIGDIRLVKCYVNSGLSRLTMTEESGGSLHFMPVDQFVNYKYSKPIADIWSMGATLYRLLTGKYPFNFRDEVDDARVMLSEHVLPLNNRGRQFPPGLANIVDKAVARDPIERYQSAKAFRQALEAYLGH
ncbi:MAG: serine/threonine-protein kinase [Planctomycetota bacterium]|nr:serine/threonine-protein kinase [Planctomycetota bacterium]